MLDLAAPKTQMTELAGKIEKFLSEDAAQTLSRYKRKTEIYNTLCNE
jgi:hypothetical protein